MLTCSCNSLCYIKQRLQEITVQGIAVYLITTIYLSTATSNIIELPGPVQSFTYMISVNPDSHSLK